MQSSSKVPRDQASNLHLLDCPRQSEQRAWGFEQRPWPPADLAAPDSPPAWGRWVCGLISGPLIVRCLSPLANTHSSSYSWAMALGTISGPPTCPLVRPCSPAAALLPGGTTWRPSTERASTVATTHSLATKRSWTRSAHQASGILEPSCPCVVRDP